MLGLSTRLDRTRDRETSLVGISPRCYIAAMTNPKPKRHPTFAANLREALEDAEITQEAFGREIGKPQSVISSWVNGKREPRLFNLCELSDALDLALDYLLRE